MPQVNMSGADQPMDDFAPPDVGEHLFQIVDATEGINNSNDACIDIVLAVRTAAGTPRSSNEDRRAWDSLNFPDLGLYQGDPGTLKRKVKALSRTKHVLFALGFSNTGVLNVEAADIVGRCAWATVDGHRETDNGRKFANIAFGGWRRHDGPAPAMPPNADFHYGANAQPAPVAAGGPPSDM